MRPSARGEPQSAPEGRVTVSSAVGQVRRLRPRVGAGLPLTPHTLIGWFVLFVLALLAGGPIALVVWTSINVAPPGGPAHLTLDAWSTALQSPAVLDTLRNSVMLSVSRVGIGGVIAIVFVWLIVRTNLPGRNLIEFLLWLPFFLPALPVTLGWILLLDPHYGLINKLFDTLPFVRGPLLDIYSFWGITFVHVTHSTVSAMVILMGPAFRMLDPSVEESAHMSGANRFQVLTRITLPILAPAIVAAMLLSLIRSLESFEVEQVLGTPAGLFVFPTSIYNRLRYEPPEWGVASALGTMLLVLLLIILGLGRSYLGGRAYATVGGRGISRTRVDLGSARWLAFSACLGFIAVTSVLPVSMLILGSFMTLYGFFEIEDAFTFANWASVLNDSLLLTAVRNTLVLGLGVGAISTLSMAILGYALARRSIANTRAIEFFAWLPWTVPGILLGLGLLWAFLSNPLLRPIYGSMAGLMLAIIIKEMPLAMQLMKAAVGQISRELEEAAWLSGGSWWRTFRAIIFPLVAPAGASVMVLTFMAAARDISTVVLLSTPDTTPLSLLVLQHLVAGSLESAAVVGVIISGLVVVLAAISRWLGFKAGFH